MPTDVNKQAGRAFLDPQPMSLGVTALNKNMKDPLVCRGKELQTEVIALA